MCDRSCSSVHVFNVPTPKKSNKSLLTALENVDFNLFLISVGSFNLVMVLYHCHESRNIAQSLSTESTSMLSLSGCFACADGSSHFAVGWLPIA